MSALKKHTVRLLRWSEQYTKTDMVYLTKGGFWLLLGHGIQIASGLVLAVAFANLLSKETYGTYQFVMSMAGILSAFTLSRMGTAITRAVAQGDEGALRHGFRIKLNWNIGIAFAAAALSLYYYLNGNNVLAISFLIIGAFSPFLESFSLYQPYLLGKQLFRESAMLGFWRKPLPLASLLIALVFTNNPAILVLVYFASHTTSAALLYGLIIRKYHLPLVSSTDLLNYSRHLSAMSITNTIANNIDKLLLFHFLGAVPVATYTLAETPVKHIQKTFGLISSLTFPKFSTKKFAILKETLPRKVRLSLLGLAGLVALYLFLAPYLFAFLFPAYPESILISQVLVLIVLSAPRSLYGDALMAHGMKWELYFMQISPPILRIILLLILVPLYGVWGAVYALLATHAYSNILVRYLFHRSAEKGEL